MVLMNYQFIITLIVMCIIQKVSPYFSFGSWILCSTGLKRYLHPNNNELKTLCGISTKEKFGGKNLNKKQSFYVPKNLNFHLYITNIVHRDIVHLKYFEEYKWFIDFSLYTAIVYVLSEIFCYFFPNRNDINFSLIWCLIAIFFGIKYLFGLILFYFKYEESIGERSLCIVAFFAYLLLAMIVLILDENTLETGLEEAYNDFNKKAMTLLDEFGLPSVGVTSKIVLKFFVAVCCGLLGSLFIFPGIRVSKMHKDSLRQYKDDKLMQLALNISFVLPFISVILWIRPVARDRLTLHTYEGMTAPLLTPRCFETVRLLFVLFTLLLRFTLLPVYIQSYLNIAYDRIQNMKKEAGRITNIELQQRVSSIFYYLCVAVLQFIAPLIICFYTVLLYKSLSNIKWMTCYRDSSHLNISTKYSGGQNNAFSSHNKEHTIFESATNFQTVLYSLREVFSVTFYKGLLGFSVWWICFTLFSTSSFGLLYHSYFANA